MAIAVPLLQIGLSLMFLAAGAGKLAVPRGIRQVLGQLGVRVDPTSMLLPLAEIGTGVLIAVAPTHAATMVLTLGMLATFFVVGVMALATRRAIDCACFGVAGGTLGWRQVVVLPLGAGILVLIGQNGDAALAGATGAQAAAFVTLALAVAVGIRLPPKALHVLRPQRGTFT